MDEMVLMVTAAAARSGLPPISEAMTKVTVADGLARRITAVTA